MTPSCKPINPVSILKGDPGEYSPDNTRLYKGLAKESLYSLV